MKRRLSFKQKEEATKKIKQELKAFIKENKTQILVNARNDLGNNLSAQKIYSMFRENFYERLEESGNEYSITNARKMMKKTLHTETFTGNAQINYENLRTALIKSGEWETFRSGNRRQKIIIDNFNKVKAPTGVRTRWQYNTIFGRIIYIDIIYKDSNFLEFKVSYV